MREVLKDNTEEVICDCCGKIINQEDKSANNGVCDECYDVLNEENLTINLNQ